MSITTKANSRWEGNLREGSGTMRLPSGTYEGPYTFKSRFGSGASPEDGTNPEELIGAAHAGCFSQYLALLLSQNGTPPNAIDTTAKVSIVTHKVQTTRAVVRGIATHDNAQIVFVDTPGLHRPLHRLGRFLERQAAASLEAADSFLAVRGTL